MQDQSSRRPTCDREESAATLGPFQCSILLEKCVISLTFSRKETRPAGLRVPFRVLGVV